MFKRRKFKYTDLKPGDRIRKLIEEYVEPEMSKHGFKLLKSELTFKRKINDFTQEIYFAKNQRNFGSSIVKFWTIISVKSNFYVKWHEKTFGFKPMNEFVNSWYDSHISSWSSKYRNGGHYDLAKYDNIKLMNELNRNILEIGVPMLNEVSDWEQAANNLMTNKQYGFISKVFDFYLLAGKKNKAIESISLVEEYFNSIQDAPIERFEEIKIRKDYLQQGI